MRSFLATLLIAALATSTLAAQTDEQMKVQQMHRARAHMLTGVAMMVAGAFVLPVTTRSQQPSAPAMAAGLGLVFGGTIMMWWGAKQQRAAASGARGSGVIWQNVSDGRYLR